MCTKVTLEKRQEFLEKLLVYEAAEAVRRSPHVAVDPNVMGRSRGSGMETGGTSSRSVPPHAHTSAPYPSDPTGMATPSTRPRQSTLEENWNPRLKEETDMAVARFFFHDHIAFHVAR